MTLSVTLEKIASEAAREILRDPAFKAELKLAAQRSIGRADVRSKSRRPNKRRQKTK